MYERFKQLLDENNITSYRVAKETGIRESSLSDWKTGRANPKLDTLKKIADYFDVSLDWLTGRSEYRNYKHFEKEIKKSVILSENEEKLRSVARLENSELTPDEDAQILDFIEYLQSKHNNSNG